MNSISANKLAPCKKSGRRIWGTSESMALDIFMIGRYEEISRVDKMLAMN